MNAQQPQGQPGQGQAQAQALRIPMYRPEQMRNLEILSDSDKEKYERGLRGLWDTMEKNNPDTTAHKQAKSKISEFSRMVWGKVTTMRRQRAEQISGGAQAGPQNPPAPNQAALAAQRAGMAQPRPAPASNNGAAPGQPRPAPPTTQFSQHLIQAVNTLQINPPATIANDADKVAKYRQDVRGQYMKALALMDQNQKKMIHLNTVVKERGTKGPPLSPEEQAKYSAEMEQCKKLYSDGKRFAEQIKLKASQGQPDGVGAQPGPSSVQGPPGQAARPQPISTTGNPIQAATASVSAAIGAAKNASSTVGLQPATPTTGTSAPPPQAIALPGQPAQSAIAPPQPQPQVKIEPGSQQQHPPPVNTALAAATSTGSAAGTPTQHSARGVQGVQAATSTAAGPPSAARPLSHPAALALANKSSTNSVPTLGQQGLAGTASAITPGSAGIANTPQAAHSHAHPPQIGAQHPGGAVHVPKMPIPKTLPERAQQIPQPVAAGGGVSAGRPTLGNGMGTAGGTMNQPVIQKNPAFTFEAEGEHILDKKKLNELVRQCCGGGPPGQDGNYLTPDVEENCQLVADGFLDNVLNMSCRLAKERGSKVLEIRDIQLVLERVYNIRVPGFTSDELRTVRKPQPSNAWLSKISAVQAAKATAATSSGDRQGKTKAPAVNKNHGMAFARMRPAGAAQGRERAGKGASGTDAKSVWGSYDLTSIASGRNTTQSSASAVGANILSAVGTPAGKKD